ncbi:MAG: serine protease [Bacteroidota bacterium]
MIKLLSFFLLTLSVLVPSILSAQNLGIPSKQEDQKYLVYKPEQEELPASKMKILFISKKNYERNQTRNSRDISPDEGAMDLVNYDFGGSVRKLLRKAGYTDSTRKILRQNGNTCYLDSEIKNIKVYMVAKSPSPYSTPLFFVADFEVEWKIKTIYGELLYAHQYQAETKELRTEDYDKDEIMTETLAEGLKASMVKMMRDEGTIEALKKQEASTDSLSQLTISAPGSSPSSPAEAQQATVTVKVEDGHGSGFFVSQDGYILTNYHVVVNQKENLEILTGEGETYKATFVRSDQENDLALLKVEAQPAFAFSLPSEKNYSLGNSIFAIGTPKSIELGQTLSRGIVSGERKVGENKLLQIDASINSGNSGGPIISSDGQLVGIVNSKLIGLGIEGIAFGTPAYKLMEFLKIELE